MIKELLRQAESGGSLWLPDLRESFASSIGARKAIVRLLGSTGSSRDYELFFPPADGAEEEAFLQSFLHFRLAFKVGFRLIVDFVERHAQSLVRLVETGIHP